MEIIFLPVIIAIMVVVIGVIAIPVLQTKQKEIERTGKYPKGHFLGLGIALGIPLGLPIGLAMGNIGLGPALGLPIGAAIGLALEQKNADKIRPLTDKEKKIKQKTLIALVIVMLAGLIAGAGLFWYLNRQTPQSVLVVNNFDDCVAAGNPVMESYPAQCRHNDQLFVEIIPGQVGDFCEVSTDCNVPMEYMVQSNCPYQAYCVDHYCVVACPLWEHSPDPEESISYQVACTNDSECDCSGWDVQNRYNCACLDGQCASIVETNQTNE